MILANMFSGEVEPSQDKLEILSMALNVSRSMTWVLICTSTTLYYIQILPQSINYNQLDDFGKKEATKRVEEVTTFFSPNILNLKY